MERDYVSLNIVVYVSFLKCILLDFALNIHLGIVSIS
jgi:hypothetical protein